MGTATVDVEAHFNGHAAGEKQFADGFLFLQGAAVGEFVGHFFVFEFVGVDEEFVFQGFSVPGIGAGGGVFVTAHGGVFPVVDNHAHGSGYAAGRAALAADDGAVVVVRLDLVPLGLDEDAFAFGFVGEGLVGQFFPHAEDFGSWGGVGVLVLADEFGVAVEHVLTCGVDVFRIEVSDGRVGQDGFGAVGGRDHYEAVARHVEGIQRGDAESGVVEL